MKSIILGTAAAAALTVGLSGAALAEPSAKFAADWSDQTVELVPLTALVGPDAGDGGTTIQPIVGVGTELLAEIKAPKHKELLIGVSGVANLVTFTEAKGKNGGGTSTAIAEGAIDLAVRYGPDDDFANAAEVCAGGTLAAPGGLTFASRRQELSVTVDLDVIDDPNNNNNLAQFLDIEGSVTVALGLDTTAAHHFNFVAADLEQSANYLVAACFTGRGELEVSSSELDVNTARTMVAIQHRMVTVQQVRAVQGAFD